MSQVLVEVTRGNLVENIHRGDIAIVDTTGRLLRWVGEPTRKVTYWRSSAKPFQAMPIVESGAADHWGLTDADLAVACASHNAEDVHQQQVLSILGKAGLTPEVLSCGAHAPNDRETADALVRAGVKPNVLHSNCSGKHSGMCALAKHLGLPTEGYLNAEHSLQQLILQNISYMTDLSPERIAVAVDGCGVPVFGIPVYSMALAFARLADPRDLTESKRIAADRIRNAMVTHPYLVAGRKKCDTELMQLCGGEVVCKSGAAGVYCLGFSPERAHRAGLGEIGIGVAVKLEDGNGAEPRTCAALEACTQAGLLTSAELESLVRYHRAEVRNIAGRVVGEVRPAFQLEHT